MEKLYNLIIELLLLSQILVNNIVMLLFDIY